ncbi:MAG: AIPR family protein [Desulfobacterium sp.]|nr:AIPR family protein [Desulfobacterium sp.]
MMYEEFFKDFMQDIYARSESKNDFSEVIFTERVCDFLVEQAVLENYTPVSYKKKTMGLKVDAYNSSENFDTLILLVTDFHNKPGSLTKTLVGAVFNRAMKFFEKSLDKSFYQSLDESDCGFSLAREINVSSKNLRKVQIILLSNALLSKSVKAIPEQKIQSVPISFDIWDLGRIQRIEESGKFREDIIVDFSSLPTQGLPCLPAFTGTNTYKSYLLAMPGPLVADLYDKYGERLLEQNVRTFLQFRGKVNKGIRTTIQNEPEMFFAYNNGITATAEEVTTTETNELVSIKSIKNFQIVNGGQTTASLFNSQKKNKIDLSNVHVQVKLTVIPQEETEHIVPKISEYANTQNKVNAADFFSNHPFHMRMEEISRRLWAPSSEGSLRETHWYYERVRGQYANAQINLTTAKKKEFLTANPRKQMFIKTDMAKFRNSWNMKPHVVSLGAQKNFVRFAESVSQNWEKHESEFNELFFKRMIAKTILFRTVDKFIMKQHWYGGYKANIVTYTVAKFSLMIEQTGMFLDLENIWKRQSITAEMEELLVSIAEAVNSVIQKTPTGITNVTEWCKKELCWQNVQNIPLKISPQVQKELITKTKKKQNDSDAKSIQAIDNGIHAQEYVLKKGAVFWSQIINWSRSNKIFSPMENSLLQIASQIPSKIPTEKQSLKLKTIEQKAEADGFKTYM